MKKLLGIIVLGLLLSGCNHDKDYPTSLFGVKVLSKASDFLSKDLFDELATKYKEIEIFDTYKGNYTRNNLFLNNYIYSHIDDIILSVGGVGYNYVNINETFSDKCKRDRNKLFVNLKDLHNIKERDFNKQYYIRSFKNKTNKDYYEENYFYEYKIDKIKYSLNILCRYSYKGNQSIQKLLYSLSAHDLVKDIGLNPVTDKSIIDALNRKSGITVKFLKKPLSGENIKNDFRGL